MKIFSFLVALSLAGCTGTSEPMSLATVPGQMTTEAEFAALAGRRLETGEADFVVLNADGTLTGVYGGIETLGTWELRDGYFCRVVTTGPAGAMAEDCQLFVRDGNQLTISRDKGAGKAAVYTIT